MEVLNVIDCDATPSPESQPVLPPGRFARQPHPLREGVAALPLEARARAEGQQVEERL